MNLWMGVLEGFREIWSHKFRSLLTGLGVVLGVASLMSMFAITNGLAIAFRGAMETWGGAEKVRIINSPVPEEQESIKDQSPGRTYRDVEALRTSPLVQYVDAEQRLKKGGIIEYRSHNFRSGWIRGVEKNFLEIENHQIAAGRFFNDLDQIYRSRVMVIGQHVKRVLFGSVRDSQVIGKKVVFNGVGFQICGVFRDYDNRWKNRVVVVPFQTMQDLFFSSNVIRGIDQGAIRQVDSIMVKVRDVNHLEEAIDQMRNILLQTHKGVEDFGFDTREDTLEETEAAVWGMRLSGLLVSGVTLIAAGVGITNIMMASIRERTREIGVRRALGAGSLDVFVQICMEALVLAALGGLAGLISGYLLIGRLEILLEEYTLPVLSPEAMWISLGAAVMIGFAAGVAPAFKASQMKPIEALRFE